VAVTAEAANAVNAAADAASAEGNDLAASEDTEVSDIDENDSCFNDPDLRDVFGLDLPGPC
jgi:hypothetical protein